MADNGATYDRLVRLADEFDAQRDKRAIFLRCYAMMTANMQAALAAGEFHDGAWVDRWLDHFGDYYFRALEAYNRVPATAPRIWRLTHELAKMPATSPIEDLLLGVNAHINGDLPLALRDMLAPDWATLTPEQRERHHEDHLRVNAVIARTTDAVRRDVVERYSHLLCVVDHVCFPATELAEWEVGRIIASWRDAVWEHAVRLVEEADALGQEFLRYDIEGGAIHRVRILVSELDLREHLLGLPIEELRRLHPNPPDPHAVLRERRAGRVAGSALGTDGGTLPAVAGDAGAGARVQPAGGVAVDVGQPAHAAGGRRRWFWGRG